MLEYDSDQLVQGVSNLVSHEAIILRYIKTGQLDRKHAIQVYRRFSEKNPGYTAAVQAQAPLWNSGIDLSTASDDVIVRNLNQQIIYLGGKNLLEGLYNGK